MAKHGTYCMRTPIDTHSDMLLSPFSDTCHGNLFRMARSSRSYVSNFRMTRNSRSHGSHFRMTRNSRSHGIDL